VRKPNRDGWPVALTSFLHVRAQINAGLTVIPGIHYLPSIIAYRSRTWSRWRGGQRWDSVQESQSTAHWPLSCHPVLPPYPSSTILSTYPHRIYRILFLCCDFCFQPMQMTSIEGVKTVLCVLTKTLLCASTNSLLCVLTKTLLCALTNILLYCALSKTLLCALTNVFLCFY
jgi:hypothetical protein